MSTHRFVLSVWLLGWMVICVSAADTPVLPIGLDAYRQWERWPAQRIGARAYMRSTYDRRGGNEGADASHFLYQAADDFNVSLDVAGPGALYFVRCNHWHGSPWHYEVDGVDHVVRETATADPVNAKQVFKQTTFIPDHLFPNPLTWTWSITKGADLNWLPLPFEHTFRLAYGRTHYGTGYYIYHLYDRSAPLSQPIQSWDGKSPPGQDVLDLIRQAGTDLVPAVNSKAGRELKLREISGSIPSGVNQSQVFASLSQTPTMIRALEFMAPTDCALDFGRARLRATWDNRSWPSIEAPVALFFGAGALYNRDGREYLVKGFPMFIRHLRENQPAGARDQEGKVVHLACFYPMPFFRAAKFELLDLPTTVSNVTWRIRFQPCADPPGHVGYFHSTYRDHPAPERGHDLTLLDTRNQEGSADWSGSFVGMSWIFSHRAVLTTLEGDPRFFFDDSQTPQAYGTGTEEWGGGGDYWGGRNMTLPFAGHPCGAPNAQAAQCDEDMIQSAYRFLLADLMPFGKRAVIRLEHGGENQSTEHYESVVYWYGWPKATLVKTDELKIGDPQSEQAHQYVSPDASAPCQITSRYEWGVDTLPSRVENDAEHHPLAHPTDFAEFEFEAQSDVPYFIWVRGKNLDGTVTSDACWFQFDEHIGTEQLAASCNHPKGFGNWLDRFPRHTYAWSSALPQDPPQTITFDRSGKHRLRIQSRHAGHYLDLIWLSPTQKSLPAETQIASQTPGEILLTAAKPNQLIGRIKPVNDDDSATGQVLSIGRGSLKREQIVYPSHTDRGRKMTGISQFTLRLEPDNYGVVLRRKLDYAFPNQRAEVFVADGQSGEPDWRKAGIWYLAGANTCVYSNPKEELGATQHQAQTSNRRFRDDEFIIPRDLTRHRDQVRIQIRFTPVKTPLFPGHPLPELAWSEIRYEAYCWMLPKAP